MTNAIERKASDKQVAFIAKLVAQKDLTGVPELTVERLSNPEIVRNMSVQSASHCIGELLKRNDKPVDKAAPEKGGVITEDGMYFDRENVVIYKVQYNRASGDGRKLYAKRLRIESDEGKYHVHFEYEMGAVKRIKPEWKMTLAEAEAFGAMYGVCVRCGRDLTAEESIARAMGPVCAGKFGA